MSRGLETGPAAERFLTMLDVPGHGPNLQRLPWRPWDQPSRSIGWSRAGMLATMANAGYTRSDLRLRSQWFSKFSGRSRGDVPPVCPGCVLR
jgi:hypothetical protein